MSGMRYAAQRSMPERPRTLEEAVCTMQGVSLWEKASRLCIIVLIHTSGYRVCTYVHQSVTSATSWSINHSSIIPSPKLTIRVGNNAYFVLIPRVAFFTVFPRVPIWQQETVVRRRFIGYMLLLISAPDLRYRFLPWRLIEWFSQAATQVTKRTESVEVWDFSWVYSLIISRVCTLQETM